MSSEDQEENGESGRNGSFSGSASSSMRMSSSAHGNRPHVPAFLRNLQSRGGAGSGTPGTGGFSSSSPDASGSLFDLMGDGDRVNSLDLVSEETLLKVKRGLWFIVRGQKINTIDGVADFFEQVKEEMGRQQLRDETEAAGGTANFIESMVSSMNSRQSTSDSFSSSSASVASSSNSVVSSNASSRPPPRVVARPSKKQQEENDVAREQAQQPLSQEEKRKQLERLEKEAAAEGRLPPIVKARTVLDYAIETQEQKEQRAITDFIERSSDPVSLAIVASQLFVLYSVGIHAGFNMPITATDMVIDKIFGDLVALICILYRCFAPYKQHGMWHFNTSERAWHYFVSGRMIIDIVGIFPLDLIGYGAGSHCAWTVPERCALVGGHWQLNRLAQTWGMFDTVGAALESLFLRKGLHPILGRVAEVLLLLVCLAHVVACGFNLLLSRGDRSVLGEFFGDEVENATETMGPDRGFLNKTIGHQYFIVSDWAIKSLVGLSPRGTSFPDDGVDQAVVICITIIGVAMFTLWIATIKLYFDRDCPEKTHGQLVDETIDMVQYMHLEDEFRDECLDYFNHMFGARFHMSGMRDFEDDLAGGLARKMRFVVGRELVQHVPLLRSLEDNEPFIVSLMQRIEPLVLPPETIIFKRDELGSTMLVIIKGKVAVLNPVDDKSIMATLGPGRVVGEVALLMDAPRTATVVSCDSFINVLSLDRRQMGELIMLFPEIAPILMQQMAERMRDLAAKKAGAAKK